jgi:hypothetical protein
VPARLRLPAIAALIAFALGAMLLVFDRARFVATFHDDAYYYATTARHVARGDGVTFDGRHTTTGFHPLWLALLVPVHALVPGDLGALAATHALEIALVAAATCLAYATLAPRLGAPAALVVALGPTALPGAASAMRGGMEGALMLLLLVATWRQWLAVHDDARPPVSTWLRLGALLAVLVLGRLDALVVLAGVAWMERARLRAEPKAALALVGPGVGVAAAYAVVLRVWSGAWLPVNALVKAHLASLRPMSVRLRMALDVPWPGARLLAFVSGGPVWMGPTWARVADVVGMVVVLGLVWRWRALLGARLRAAGAVFPVMAGLTMTGALLVGVGLLQDWYLPPFALAMAATLGAVVAPSRRASRCTAIAVVVVLLVRPVVAVAGARLAAPPYTAERLQTAAWLEANADGAVGAWDAGVLGYFSHRAVLPLDGLVNDVPFYRDVIVGGRMDDYLRAEHVQFVTIPTCEDSPPSPTELYPRLAARFRDPRGCPGDAVFSPPKP